MNKKTIILILIILVGMIICTTLIISRENISKKISDPDSSIAKNKEPSNTATLSEIKKFQMDGKFVEDYGEYELIRDSLATTSPTVYHNKKYGFRVTAPCYECFAYQQEPNNPELMDIESYSGVEIGQITFRVDDTNILLKYNENYIRYANLLLSVNNGKFNRINLGNAFAFEISAKDIVFGYNPRTHSQILRQYVFNIKNSSNLFLVATEYYLLGYEDNLVKTKESLKNDQFVLSSITFDK